MIIKKTKPDTEIGLKKILHPLVSQWFFSKFNTFSMPQLFGVMEVHSRKNVLVSAPTGTGKCVTPDTVLLVEYNGEARLMTGKELIDQAQTEGKKIEHINSSGNLYELKNLKSYSFNGGQIDRAEALVYSEEIDNELIFIKTEYGREVKLSKDHPLLKETESGFAWTKAEQIQVGDKIGVPQKINLPEKEIFFDVNKAVSNLRCRVKTVVDYNDFQKLKIKLLKDKPELNKDDFLKLKLLARLEMEDFKGITDHSFLYIYSKIQKDEVHTMDNLIPYFKKAVNNISFESNRVHFETKNGLQYSFIYPKKLGVELARWLSFILAEGLIGKYKAGSSIIVSQKKRTVLLKEFLTNSKRIFDVDFKKKSAKDYTYNNTYFCYFICDLFGLKMGRGRDVSFPDWLLNAKKEIKKNFVNVFLSLEGYIPSREESMIEVVQSNQKKIEMLNYLLLSFGIFSSVNKRIKYASNTPRKVKRQYYFLTIAKHKYLKKYLNEIGIVHQNKNRLQKLIKSAASGHHTEKYIFDYNLVSKLAKYFESYDVYLKEFGSITEVARRTGYLTESSLERLKEKILKFKIKDDYLKGLLMQIQRLLDFNVCFLKVKQKKYFYYKGQLFDLSVPNYENFIGGFGAIYLHNTLVSFLSVLNELIDSSKKGLLKDKVYCVYVSPLKALNNDIQKNLLEPLAELEELNRVSLGIKVGLRTGDTTQYERSKLLKNPPHILITTPESLALMLSSIKFKELLKDVEWGIVDELHALAENKRGVHLSLSLERLQYLSSHMTRVGLSATVSPIEKMAEFLAGNNRDCVIVDVQYIKKYNLGVYSPVKDLINTDFNTLNNEMYKYLDKLIQEHKTTLIFTNTRAGTERVVHHLKDKFPQNYLELKEGVDVPNKLITAHHGSLSKNLRFETEEKLRKGELKTVVCLDEDTKILDGKGNWVKIKNIPFTNVQSINNKFKINNSKIKKIFESQNNQELIKLTSQFGKEIICTKNHKFMTIDERGQVIWKEVQELEEGEFIASIRNYNFENYNPEELKKIAFEHYPEEYYLYFNNVYLNKVKQKICLNFGALKSFWDLHFKEMYGYNVFVKKLRGISGLKVGAVKKLIEVLNLDLVDLFNNINSVSSTKYLMDKPVLNKNMMRYIGFMLAEGYINEGDTFVTNKNGQLLLYYKELIKSFSRKNPWIKIGSTGTPIIGWSSKFLVQWLINLGFKKGRKARVVNIPDFIFRLDSESVFSFLSGYFDGDGFVEVKDERVYSAGFCTTSKEMAEDISRLLLREGILSSIRSKYCDSVQNYKGRLIIKKGMFYTVMILGGNNLRKFATNINPVRNNLKKIRTILFLNGYMNLDVIPNLGKKLRKIREITGVSLYKLGKQGLNPSKYESGMRNISRKQLKKLLLMYKCNGQDLFNLSDSDLVWEKIRDKKLVQGKNFVYNLEVENDHNYIANGFLTKNCSTSLELGIDIGYIDLVLCLGSPKSVARFLQRVGRASHKLDGVVKGQMIVTDRDDLVECSVLLKNAIEKKIDEVHIPTNCLDVLAQQIVGLAIEQIWDERELFEMVKKSYCFKDLTWEDYNQILDYLSGEFAKLEERHVYAKIWHNKGKIGKRGSMTRVIYMTNIGTIPDQTGIIVKVGLQSIGTIDEMFLEKLKAGDIFVLGGDTYKFRNAKGMVAYVGPAGGRRPTVPSWASEMLPLSFDLAMDIQKFRRLMHQKMGSETEKKEILDFIKEYLYLEDITAEAIYNYFKEQHDYAEIPHDKKILIEHYIDENEKRYVVFHTLFGRRVNDVLSRGLGYAISRTQHKDVELGINDNGFYLSYNKPVNVMGAFKLLESEKLREIMVLAIDKSEVLKRRFRHCAGRSLMILRQYKGHKKRVGRQQVSSMILLNAVRRISENFVILKEARREVLEDLMDIDNAVKILKGVEDKKIEVKEIFTVVPTPFAFNLIVQGYSDILKVDDKIEFLKRMHQLVLAKISLKK